MGNFATFHGYHFCRPFFWQTMKQAIAGVAPPQKTEVTVMTIWPSIAALPIGRFLGRLMMLDWGIGVLNVGNLVALLAIPIVVPLYFSRLAVALAKEIPFLGVPLRLAPESLYRYRLTNRRVLIEKGARALPDRWVELERFDSVEVVIRPGQEWFRAGDLVFRKGQIETFRLVGVPRPETFRHTCLKASAGFVGAAEAVAAG
jgi:hypothetical protein